MVNREPELTRLNDLVFRVVARDGHVTQEGYEFWQLWTRHYVACQAAISLLRHSELTENLTGQADKFPFLAQLAGAPGVLTGPTMNDPRPPHKAA